MASPPPTETPRPPMSMTSLPSHTSRVVTPAPVKPPVLASDILREEVAPIHPAQRAIRVWLVAFAATFALGAFAAAFGIGPFVLDAQDAFLGALATSALAAITAFLPLPYAMRAALAAFTGFVPLALGAAGRGPLAAFGDEGGLRAGTAIVLVTLLPAALVFRARYRAFAGARAALGVALALSAPALALLAFAAFDEGAPVGDRVASGAAAASALTALLGFMGPETSAGCAQWAGLVVIVHTSRLTLHAARAAWSGDAHGIAAFGAAALGELIASTLVTFALFQILAALLSSRARQVDVHQIVGAGAPSHPDTERMRREPRERE
jgi:hypothetical protein